MQFERWLNGDEPLPQYMKTARTVFLSKEDTEFPKIGNVRIISILPAITKLWDTILLQKLREEIELRKPLHENQRGFVRGGSCLKNIDDLYNLLAKEKERYMKVKYHPRPKEPQTYIFFVDLKKAFDTINRGILL